MRLYMLLGLTLVLAACDGAGRAPENVGAPTSAGPETVQGAILPAGAHEVGRDCFDAIQIKQ